MAPHEHDDPALDVAARLQAMRTQEASRYAVPDYLADGWQRTLRDAETTSTSSSSVASGADASDWASTARTHELWRRHIGEWFYRLVDRFGETLVVSFLAVLVRLIIALTRAHLLPYSSQTWSAKWWR